MTCRQLHAQTSQADTFPFAPPVGFDMRVDKRDFPGHATWAITAENDGEYLMLEMLMRALQRSYGSPPPFSECGTDEESEGTSPTSPGSP